MKKLFYIVLTSAFSLMLLFILLITSFEAVCYWDRSYYQNEFEKYEVSDSLKRWRGEEMEIEAFQTVINETMRYLRGDRENLIVEVEINDVVQEFYNENEKSHMADVRVLFLQSIVLRALFILSCIAIFAVLVFLKNKEAFFLLAQSYLRVCLAILLLSLLFGILAMQDFTRYFTIFHEIFFSQGNWMFDPRESRMIVMLPEGFFQDTATRIGILFLGSSSILGIVSFLIHKGFRNRKKAKT